MQPPSSCTGTTAADWCAGQIVGVTWTVVEEVLPRESAQPATGPLPFLSGGLADCGPCPRFSHLAQATNKAPIVAVCPRAEQRVTGARCGQLPQLVAFPCRTSGCRGVSPRASRPHAPRHLAKLANVPPPPQPRPERMCCNHQHLAPGELPLGSSQRQQTPLAKLPHGAPSGPHPDARVVQRSRPVRPQWHGEAVAILVRRRRGRTRAWWRRWGTALCKRFLATWWLCRHVAAPPATLSLWGGLRQRSAGHSPDFKQALPCWASWAGRVACSCSNSAIRAQAGPGALAQARPCRASIIVFFLLLPPPPPPLRPLIPLPPFLASCSVPVRALLLCPLPPVSPPAPPSFFSPSFPL